MTLDLRQPIDMVWSPDGIRLAVTDGAGANRNSSGADTASGINVVDFSADATVTQFFPGASQPRFSTEGSYLFYRPRDGTEVRYYSFQNRVNTGYYRPFKTGEPASFDGFAISPDYGKMLVAKGDAVEVWDIARSERLASWSGAIVRQFRRDPNSLQLSMSPDNESLLVVSPQDGIKVLSWSPPAVRFVAAGPVGEAASPQQVQALRAAFSPNGKWLAALAPTSAGSGNALTLHDGRSGKIALRIEAPTFAVAIAFSPDSKTLAYLTADDVVRFIDVASLR